MKERNLGKNKGEEYFSEFSIELVRSFGRNKKIKKSKREGNRKASPGSRTEVLIQRLNVAKISYHDHLPDANLPSCLPASFTRATKLHVAASLGLAKYSVPFDLMKSFTTRDQS